MPLKVILEKSKECDYAICINRHENVYYKFVLQHSVFPEFLYLRLRKLLEISHLGRVKMIEDGVEISRLVKLIHEKIKQVPVSFIDGVQLIIKSDEFSASNVFDSTSWNACVNSAISESALKKTQITDHEDEIKSSTCAVVFSFVMFGFFSSGAITFTALSITLSLISNTSLIGLLSALLVAISLVFLVFGIQHSVQKSCIKTPKKENKYNKIVFGNSKEKLNSSVELNARKFGIDPPHGLI